jgi:hypothetical protein
MRICTAYGACQSRCKLYKSKIDVQCIKQNSSTDVTVDDISYIYWETACLYLDIWCLTLMQLHMLW